MTAPIERIVSDHEVTAVPLAQAPGLDAGGVLMRPVCLFGWSCSCGAKSRVGDLWVDPINAGAAGLAHSVGDCGEQFRWAGLQAGMSFVRPMVSVDEQTWHAPMRPASADPDFGLGPPFLASFPERPAAA